MYLSVTSDPKTRGLDHAWFFGMFPQPVQRYSNSASRHGEIDNQNGLL